MPRVRRRQKAMLGYTRSHVEQLQRGFSLFPEMGFGVDLLNGPQTSNDQAILDATMRAAWADIGPGILAEWLKEKPGTRPWAWWEFVAPEPRRCLNGPGNSVVRNPSAPAWMRRLWFGKPRVLGCPEDFGCEYESEEAYLRRLGLLTADERRALKARATGAQGL